MKRCPECRRDYFDDSLAYCLDDGSPLLDGPGFGSLPEPPTVRISTPAISAESLTRQIENKNGGQQDIANTIAVLPFVNIGRDENAEYFSDGLAEELLHVLSKMDGLRVAGRTSSFSFKGKQTTFKEIGEQLKVSTVLEGSVRMAGNRVRIGVNLVTVSDGFHLWSETYDRTLDDIFEVQDDIARSVVSELRARFLDRSIPPDLSHNVAAEVAHAAKGRTEDPEVQRLMLLGRHLVGLRTSKSLKAAIKGLETACDREPENPLCWVALGNAHYFSAVGADQIVESIATLDAALNAVNKALAIDRDHALAHALLGRIRVMREFDFRGAEICLRRAEALAPRDLDVLASLAYFELQIGRFDKSLAHLEQGLELDPLNVTLLVNYGYAAHAAGLIEDTVKIHRRILEISHEKQCTRAYLGLALLDLDRSDEARIVIGAEPDEAWRLWATAILEYSVGRDDEARLAARHMIDNYSDDCAFQIAEIYARFGEADESFKWLETAIAQRDGGLIALKFSTNLRSLYPDSRWQALLIRVGFPADS